MENISGEGYEQVRRIFVVVQAHYINRDNCCLPINFVAPLEVGSKVSNLVQ